MTCLMRVPSMRVLNLLPIRPDNYHKVSSPERLQYSQVLRYGWPFLQWCRTYPVNSFACQRHEYFSHTERMSFRLRNKKAAMCLE